MDLDELRNLDFNNPGTLPTPVKAVILAIVVIGITVAAWYFQWDSQRQQIARAQAEEQQLRDEFELKQRRAANLPAYEEQLEEMKRNFGDMLRQLPSRAEVSELLVDISQSGLAAGLQFELFQPQGSVRKDFYAELPVSIRVRGQYHEFGNFISAVANLPRIVTVHDIAVQNAGGGRNNRSGGSADTASDLVMTLTARTYWYVDEAEGGSQ